jgi:hypothetical protein
MLTSRFCLLHLCILHTTHIKITTTATEVGLVLVVAEIATLTEMVTVTIIFLKTTREEDMTMIRTMIAIPVASPLRTTREIASEEKEEEEDLVCLHQNRI